MTQDVLHDQLNQAHDHLLTIHKALIDYERARYEKVHGRVDSPYTLLNLLINDPWFSWLRPISSLIAQIDEFVSSREPADPKVGEALLREAHELLTPDENGPELARNYFRALQNSGEVAGLDRQWREAIR